MGNDKNQGRKDKSSDTENVIVDGPNNTKIKIKAQPGDGTGSATVTVTVEPNSLGGPRPPGSN